MTILDSVSERDPVRTRSRTGTARPIRGSMELDTA